MEWDLETCNATLANVTVLYEALLASTVVEPTDDPCAPPSADDYSVGYHVAAVFIILVASALGTGLPLLSRYSRFGVSPYIVSLGKCIGIGIVLACALVHLLQPSNEALTSPCVPTSFNSDYPAYAYLFALLAALGMQLTDFALAQAMESYTGNDSTPSDDNIRLDKSASESTFALGSVRSSDAGELAAEAGDGGVNASHSAPMGGHVHVGPVMHLAPNASANKVLAAYMLEFGVTTHSVFIGLAVGTVDDAGLTVLLVALVFHQFFEGLALGSRLADAELPTRWHDFALATIFSVSAPIGIAIGIAVTQSLNPDGETFLLVNGIFDGICAGILLYIGFVLLLHDFPEDMQRFCSRGAAHYKWKRFGMFAALWGGAGLMAFIGRYL